MKQGYNQLKKPIIIMIGSIIFIVVVAILFISPITKYLVEKYDEKYTGRQIKMSWMYVNPFTGYIYISKLKIYESKNLSGLTSCDSVFFSANGVNANINMRKLLSKTIEITEITLNQPKGIVIQNKKEFNFSDLIKTFTPDQTNKTPSKIHFNILKINVKNGVFYYREKVIPIYYFITKVNFESDGKNWDTDTIDVKFSFLSGIGEGSAKGNFIINFKNLDYRFATIIHNFDLKFIEQYLKDLINYGNLRAKLDADIKATGNFKDGENLNAKGMLEFNEFHCGKNPEEDYASFDKLVIKIDELSPKNHKYLFDSLSINHPFFKYERYDYLDNLQMMFGKKGVNILIAKANPARFNLILQIADYIKVLAKNFFRSDYKINKLAIYNGSVQFSDYSLTEKFSIRANSLFVVADSINKNRKRVEVFIKSGIQPYGELSVALSINPKDSADFDMHYNLQKLPASLFNPYIITYTSYPLDKGTIELNGTWKVRNGKIKSNNHLLIIDPRVSKRIKNKDTKWIPTPLIMSIIRENGNCIDYQIPITGNLKNPNFHLSDVIFDILGNVFVKPPTILYRAQVKTIENEIEKSLSLKWNIRQCSLLPRQEKFVNKIVDFLEKNPEASIAIYPMQYAEKEIESILFFEAKKKFFLSSHHKNVRTFNEGDSLAVDKMSVKDSLFVHYLNKQSNDSLLFTIQDKCKKIISQDIINEKFKQVNEAREAAFMQPFRKKGLESRVKINTAENIIPYNGFSYYKIGYKGEFPRYLLKAYLQMTELNSSFPRKRLELKREINRNAQ